MVFLRFLKNCLFLAQGCDLSKAIAFRVKQSGFYNKSSGNYLVFGLKIFPWMKLSAIANEKGNILRQSSYPNCFTRISTLQFTKYGK